MVATNVIQLNYSRSIPQGGAVVLEDSAWLNDGAPEELARMADNWCADLRKQQALGGLG
jgi:hypothetical protein